MKQYSGWQALFLSFYAKDLYQDVARNWGGVGYLYLLFVICFTMLFMSVQVQVAVVPKALESINSVIEQAPNIKIQKGKLSIDKPSPYVIREPKSGNALITFDTREKPMTLAQSKSFVLVTSSAVIARKRSALRSAPSDQDASSVPAVEESYDLSTVDSFTSDKTTVQGMVRSFLQWLGILVFMVGVPFGFLLCVIQTLIYALVGKLFVSSMSLNLGYDVLVRLSAVALTPVLLLDSLLKVAGVSPPFWGFACILLALGYLYFAVYANSEVKADGVSLNRPPG